MMMAPNPLEFALLLIKRVAVRFFEQCGLAFRTSSNGHVLERRDTESL